MGLAYKKTEKNILLIMLGGIGDTIVCTPTMRILRTAFPEHKIIFLGRPPFYEVVSNELVDQFITYPNSMRGKIGLGIKLFLHNFDISVDLHVPIVNTVSNNSTVFLRNAFFTLMAHADKRVGYLFGANKYVLNKGMAYSGHTKGENITNLTQKLLRALDITIPTTVKKEIRTPERASSSIEAVLNNNEKKFCIIHHASKQTANNWKPNNFAVISDRISSRFGMKIILIGDRLNHSNAEEIKRLSGHPDQIINLSGRTSIGDTAWLIKHSDLMICVDSGPMHMADALGKPMVALFGGHQNNNLWLPISPSSRVLRGTADCSPCYRDSCENNICMDKITPDIVFKEVEDLLRDTSPTSTTI